MKLKMHSFDFGECTLTFSVPKEIMHSNSFGNVPGGVEVDLVAITKNAALGIKELAATDSQQLKESIALLKKCCGLTSYSHSYEDLHNQVLSFVQRASV